jgi:hypothetical protein
MEDKIIQIEELLLERIHNALLIEKDMTDKRVPNTGEIISQYKIFKEASSCGAGVLLSTEELKDKD